MADPTAEELAAAKTAADAAAAKAAADAAAKASAAPTAEEIAALRARAEAAEAQAAAGREAAAKLAKLEADQAAAETERLTKQGEWQKLAEQRAAEAGALQRRILTERVRSTAIAEGLIDESLVGMIPTDESFLVNGEPDQAKVAKAVADFKAAKAHFFKSTTTATGAGGAPKEVEQAGQKFDFSKLQASVGGSKEATAKALGEADAMFERAKRELRR
jgi:hypothetical protein